MIWPLRSGPRTPEAEARRIQAAALRLSHRGRTAFAAACAQRLLDAAPHDSLDGASRLLDQVWAWLAGDPHGVTPAAIQAVSDRILRDTDPAYETAYDAALAAAVHAARSALTSHRRFADWASRLALDAAQARGQLDAERARQAADLRTLTGVTPWAAMIANLRS